MTQLVYVPRHMIEIWKRRGWKLVNPEEETTSGRWAILMHPPGWGEDKKEDEKSG